MKKIFTLVAAALMAIGVNAQEKTIMSELEKGVYCVTMTLDEMKSIYPESYFDAGKVWDLGIVVPADLVLFENEDIKITAAVEDTPIFTVDGTYYLNSAKELRNGLTGIINIGCSGDLKEGDVWEEVAAMKAASMGVVMVTPKKAGTLQMGVGNITKKRTIGIYRMATVDEILDDKPGYYIGLKTVRHDGEDWGEGVESGEKGSPAYVSGAVDANREYALLANGRNNVNIFEITFTPSEGTGIENVEAVEATKVAPKKVFKNGQIMIGDFNIAGQRVK